MIHTILHFVRLLGHHGETQLLRDNRALTDHLVRQTTLTHALVREMVADNTDRARSIASTLVQRASRVSSGGVPSTST